MTSALGGLNERLKSKCQNLKFKHWDLIRPRLAQPRLDIESRRAPRRDGFDI